MSASFSARAVAIVWAALCASAVNGQSLATWSDYLNQTQVSCINNGNENRLCNNGLCYYTGNGYNCFRYGGMYSICFYTNALCGIQCYQPWTSVCLYSSGMFTVQPLGYQMCNFAAFNPQSSICANISGVLQVCPANSQICGPQCYDPTTHACIRTFEQPVLCPRGYSLCNSGDCYDPTSSSCMSYSVGTDMNKYTVCPRNFNLCGGNCYHPKQKSCRSSVVTTQLCEANDLICNTYSGAVCYDPLLRNCTKLPTDYSILCPVNNLVCMSNIGSGFLQGQCYDPATQICATDGPYTLVCPVGYGVCNGNCYSESLNVCLTVNENYRLLCSVNNQACATATGPQCFDPIVTVCASNGNYTMVCSKLNPNVCPNGQCCAFAIES